MADNEGAPVDQEPHRVAAWMPPPRLPVFTGEVGDEAVDTFVEEAERIVVAYGLRGAPGVEVIIRHLAGQARTEVLSMPAEARQDVAAVLAHLRTQFADQRPLLVLMDEFHARTQRPGESFRAYEHALQAMARKIAAENPAIYPANVVRDHYCKGLAHSGLRQFMRNWVVDHPDATLAQARERATSYASEMPEAETLFQQHQTGLSKPALPPTPAANHELDALKSQMAAVTETLANMQTTLTALSKDRGNSNNHRGPRRYTSEVRCYNCGRHGHVAYHCDQPRRPRRQAEN